MCEVAASFTFELSGVTNSSCFNCGLRNGVHTMAFAPTTNTNCWTGGACIWGEINARNFCNDGIGERWYLVDMNFGGFDGWHLLTTQFCTTNPPGGGYYADYHCVGTFDPVGNNTFSLASSGFCNMPSSITITPGDGTTYPCPC